MHTAAEFERRAEDIFAASLELPTVDRPAAVRQACDGDRQLLARVQSFAAALEGAEAFLSDATMDAAPGMAPAVVPVGERPGDRIGPYKLLEQIGEGGFGVVFMADQERPVRRRVALKVIKLGMDTREVVARFEAERQALALMDHPNIARVLDAGSTAAGRPYFVMELVRGCPITDYADGQKLTTAQRVALVAQVARAVQHAHSKGVIHRDLKPSNVLVTVTDDKPVPKVIDFGIAKATQSRLTDRTLFTGHRQLIGTPQYMSPEQADSNGSDIDTRTDVYSLGVLLYELLVGTTPMDARALRSAAFEAMRRMICEQDPAKPSTRVGTLGDTATTVAANRGTDAKQLGKQLHGELDWIVMRALEKDRSRRYDTAAALADDLNRYLVGDAVLAGPVSGTYRLRKVLGRYKLAVGVGGAVAACLLLGVAGTTWGLLQARHERTAAVASERRALVGERDARGQKAVAEANEKRARDKQAEATATLTFVNGLFEQASPKNANDDRVSKVLVDDLLKPALKTLDAQFKDQPLVQASIQESLVSTLVDLNRIDLAEPLAKAAWDTRRHELGDDDPDTEAAMRFYTLTAALQGRIDEAERLLEQAWKGHRQSWGADDPRTLTAQLAYADLEAEMRHDAVAERLFKQVWMARFRILGEDHPDTVEALGMCAQSARVQGHRSEAERLLKQAWEANRRAFGEDGAQTLSYLAQYASILNDLGRHGEAEPLLKQAWERSRRVLGDGNSVTQSILYRYAAMEENRANHAEAEPLFKARYEAAQHVYGDEDSRTISALHDYVFAMNRAGHHAAAEPVAERAWAICRRSKGEDDPSTLSALTDYATTIDDGGRHAEAEPLLRQATDAYRRAHPDDRLHGVDLYRLGECLAAQRKWPEAEAALRECWAWDKSRPGADPAGVPFSLSRLLQCLVVDHQGREAAAIAQSLAETVRRSTAIPAERAAKLHALANGLKDAKQPVVAEPMYREAIALLRRDPPGKELAATLYDDALCLSIDRHRPAETEPLFREAVALAGTCDRRSVSLYTTWLNSCLRAQGKQPTPTTEPAAEASADEWESAASAQVGVDGNRAARLYRKAIAALRRQTPVDERRVAADEALTAGLLLSVGQKSGAMTCLRDAVAIDRRLLGPRDPTTVAVARRLADLLDATNPTEAAAVRADAGLDGPATRPATRP